MFVMTTQVEMYNSENPKELLEKILNSQSIKKFGQDRIGTKIQKLQLLCPKFMTLETAVLKPNTYLTRY